jgi:ubiquinone/menaquinone biosynthesis C-methylase UbiE
MANLGLRERYQRIAPFYDLLDFPFEHGRYRHIRPLLFTGLSGRILDAGVGTGCNIPFYPADSQPDALRELRRVIKPGGTLHLLEYVRPTGALRGFIARLWEPWMAFAYGAGFDRRTQVHLRDLGFEIVESRFVVDDLIQMIEVRID